MAEKKKSPLNFLPNDKRLHKTIQVSTRYPAALVEAADLLVKHNIFISRSSFFRWAVRRECSRFELLPFNAREAWPPYMTAEESEIWREIKKLLKKAEKLAVERDEKIMGGV